MRRGRREVGAEGRRRGAGTSAVGVENSSRLSRGSAIGAGGRAPGLEGRALGLETNEIGLEPREIGLEGREIGRRRRGTGAGRRGRGASGRERCGYMGDRVGVCRTYLKVRGDVGVDRWAEQRVAWQDGEGRLGGGWARPRRGVGGGSRSAVQAGLDIKGLGGRASCQAGGSDDASVGAEARGRAPRYRAPVHCPNVSQERRLSVEPFAANVAGRRARVRVVMLDAAQERAGAPHGRSKSARYLAPGGCITCNCVVLIPRVGSRARNDFDSRARLRIPSTCQSWRNS
jgi:hypothetical protein